MVQVTTAVRVVLRVSKRVLRFSTPCGAPLSEVPEFWRAAPEAAVFWGGDEFEYPPSPRGFWSPEQADLKPDLENRHSAAGHLRAAGIRL